MTTLSSDASKPNAPFVVVQPSSNYLRIDWGEIWNYRELFFFLTWQQIKIRYKQTVLGAAWVFIQPLVMMVIFTIFFGRMAGIDTGGTPYTLFSIVGVLPWMFFSQSLTYSSMSLVGNLNLVTKVYFPRFMLPISNILAAMFDFTVASLLLIIMFSLHQTVPEWRIVFVPFFIIILLLAAVGFGLLLAGLTVKYRDVRHVTPFLIQIWMFSSPVIYSSHNMSDSRRMIYAINPMAGVIEGIRWSFFPELFDPTPMILISSLSAVIIFIVGVYYFRSNEKYFADLI